MAKVEVFTRAWCGHCRRATRVFDARGVEYEKIDVTLDPAREQEMMDRSGGRYTVPQIFIDGIHVGGADELVLLEARGKLDAMLSRGLDTDEALAE